MKNLQNLMYEDIGAMLTEKGLYADEVIYDEDNIKIYIKKYPAFVHLAGAVVSCITKSVDDDSYIIYTDSIYDMLSEKMQKACIAHEIGHAVEGHIDMYVTWVEKLYRKGLPIPKNRDFFEEISADLYSCERAGYEQLVEFLNFIIENDLTTDYGKDEIEERIEIIKKRYN